jgi:hypothetical protein
MGALLQGSNDIGLKVNTERELHTCIFISAQQNGKRNHNKKLVSSSSDNLAVYKYL